MYIRAEKVEMQTEIKIKYEQMGEMNLPLAKQLSELEELEMENKLMVEKIQKLEEEEEKEITYLETLLFSVEMQLEARSEVYMEKFGISRYWFSAILFSFLQPHASRSIQNMD
jgi:hypothetical protein